MQIKSIVSAAAIALALGLSSASAAERFATLDGIGAWPMNAWELSLVRGGEDTFITVNLIPTLTGVENDNGFVSVELLNGRLHIVPQSPVTLKADVDVSVMSKIPER